MIMTNTLESDRIKSDIYLFVPSSEKGYFLFLTSSLL